MLQFGAADADSYLPRRAAQAFVAFHDRLAAYGPNGRRSADRLRELCGSDDIYIPVYGHLLLPGSHPAVWWAASIRAALVDAVTTDRTTVAVGKIGAGICAAAASLLSQDDVFVFVVRHPATLLHTLTESTTDGMLPCEATEYLSYAFRHVRSLLGGVRAHVVAVRLEDLCVAPHALLPSLAKAAGLASEEADISRWAEGVSHVLPNDVHLPAAGPRPLDRALQQLAEEWGY